MNDPNQDYQDKLTPGQWIVFNFGYGTVQAEILHRMDDRIHIRDESGLESIESVSYFNQRKFIPIQRLYMTEESKSFFQRLFP